MGLAKVGDKVVVVRTYAEYEEIYIGEVGTVTHVHAFNNNGDDVYEVKLEGGGIKEFYEDEVEMHVPQPPKDYDETLDKPVIDEDLAHLSDGDQDLYHEIVTGLSQAIEMASVRMSGEELNDKDAETYRNLADMVALGTETPAVDLEDAPIVKELRGYRESEVNGILQDGLTEAQAVASMKRAKFGVRMEAARKAKERMVSLERDLDEARETLRKADESLAELAEEKANGFGQTHGISITDDDGWDDMPAVGKEVIYDVYNTDVVQAPSHYVNSKIEPIEYMADKLPSYNDGYVAFCAGNVLKYTSRAPHKGKMTEDLRKARQYLDFAIEYLEAKERESD